MNIPAKRTLLIITNIWLDDNLLLKFFVDGRFTDKVLTFLIRKFYVKKSKSYITSYLSLIFYR